MRTMLLIAAVGLASLALAGQAAAAPPNLPVVEVVEQDLDADLRPIGPPRTLPASELGRHAPDAADLRGQKSRSSEGPGSATRSLQSSGCRSVSVARVGKTFLGFVAYKFWQDKAWCWSYPRITYVSVGTHISNVDYFWRYSGLVGSAGWYYTWCCGNGSSGHYSFRQGRFDNVVNGRVLNTEYPWVRIWAHGNGTYSYSTGK